MRNNGIANEEAYLVGLEAVFGLLTLQLPLKLVNVTFQANLFDDSLMMGRSGLAEQSGRHHGLLSQL